MTNAEAYALECGLYELVWDTGDTDLAAVGQMIDGARWFAPVHWSGGGRMSVSTDWREVVSGRRLDAPDPQARESARAEVRRVMHEYLSDAELDRALAQNVVDALIDAVWRPTLSQEARDLTAIGNPTPVGSLWDFVRLAAPLLDLEPAPHMRAICEAVERLGRGDLMRGSPTARGETWRQWAKQAHFPVIDDPNPAGSFSSTRAATRAVRQVCSVRRPRWIW